MTHTKRITDKRGRIRIEVVLVTDRYHALDKEGNYFRYDIGVWHIPPRGTKEFNNPTMATPEEIYAAKMELWEKIKPIMPQEVFEKL